MPGLLRGAARVAVVAGTATHVSNNVSRRQQQKYAAEDAQAQATAQPQAPAQSDMAAQLEELQGLKDQGVLTQEEFDAKKKQILGL